LGIALEHFYHEMATKACDKLFFGGTSMNDENQAQPEPVSKPFVMHPGPLSIEDLLRHIHPAPDLETETFVASIYADRHEAAAAAPQE
jgi:hypothetical protein